MRMHQKTRHSINSLALETRRVRPLSWCISLTLILASTLASAGQALNGSASTEPHFVPFSWTDADNGYHVIRLTNEPGSRALDTNRNAFTPDGKDMVYTSNLGIHVLNLATRRSKLLVTGPIQSLIVGTKTRRVFFSRGSNIYLYAADIDTGVITKLGNLPVLGEIMSVNSDETLVVGKNMEPGGARYDEFLLKATQEVGKEHKVDPNVKMTADDIRERAVKMRVEAKSPESLFTVDVKTGRINIILKTTEWIGYAQFSPTDPNLLMYTHEGMYYDVNRLWLIHSDGSHNRSIHQRSQKEETANKEFWSQDGKTIWYEWEKPHKENYALVGYDVASGERRLFKMDKREASIHYNAGNGNQFFCGSGHRATPSKEGSNRESKQSIEILYPVLIDKKTQADPQSAGLFNFNDDMANTYPDTKYAGWLRRVTVANISKNDYSKLEPNIRFSPDNKLVIFTSNMLGATYIFAVELNSN